MTVAEIEQAKTHTRVNEGCRLKPYKDPAGKLTIGYGRNLQEVGISYAEAHAMFELDWLKAAMQLRAYKWNYALESAREAALIDMMFNLGAAKFAEFSCMLEAAERHDWTAVADEMLRSRWHEENRARCEYDARMVRTGLWPK